MAMNFSRRHENLLEALPTHPENLLTGEGLVEPVTNIKSMQVRIYSVA